MASHEIALEDTRERKKKRKAIISIYKQGKLGLRKTKSFAISHRADRRQLCSRMQASELPI